MFSRRRPGPRTRIVAGSDCETCRDGFITQPANTASSLAYVVAGVDLLRQPEPDKAFAWAVIGVGVGSVAYHGPGGAWGKWLHDATLLAMLGLMAGSDVARLEGRPPPSGVAPAVAAVAAVAAHPKITDYSQAAAGAVAVGAASVRFVRTARVREAAVALPLWTVGVTMQMLGRTGERWCRPEAVAQPHALWHATSAAALWTRRRF